MFDVTWYVNPAQNLYHASKVLTGLSALRRKNEINLRFVPDEHPPLTSGLFVVLKVVTGTAAACSVVIDLADTSEFFSQPALEHADVYFKRSLKPGPLESLPPHLRDRVRPFGLNFACVDSQSWSDWLAACVARARAARPLVVSDSVPKLGGDLFEFIIQPSHQVFVANPSAPKRAVALFQTRVWPPQGSQDNFTALNLERVALVTQLRTALGSHFVGGVVDSVFARATFPEAVVTDSVKRRAYAALTRSALIGVYSRGIHGSLAFKLTEYLASGCCVVAERFEHVLDIPLEAGAHYLPYDSADSCAQACKVLLKDAGLAAEMSRRNAEYFRKYLLPERHIARVLQEVASARTPRHSGELRDGPADAEACHP